MKTIEERAYQYACDNDKPASWFTDLEKSYIIGAKEQQEIDIERICNLYCEECGECEEGQKCKDCAELNRIRKHIMDGAN